MANSEILCPSDAEVLREIVVKAAADGQPLEARGGGSKRDIGTYRRRTTIVDLGAFDGVIDYEPSELVLTVGPATPLVDVETLLASRGQMLAFEPWDHGVLFGRGAGAATIGGIVAAGIAGPRRLSAGGARDHLLGFVAVSGRGEMFKGGGKVVKNVTGYDLAKVMTGSWGQLAIMTELTLKVMPSPRATTTLVLPGLTAASAIMAMSHAMGSRCAVAAAAHLPHHAGMAGYTALRLEGFRESVDFRMQELSELMVEFAHGTILNDDEAATLWDDVRTVRPLADAGTLWRVHVAPSRATRFADAAAQLGGRCLFDWAGALVWVGAASGTDVRVAAASCDGHAMLIRAPAAMRAAISVRTPEHPTVAALSTRLKHAFDPAGVLDPNRFS